MCFDNAIFLILKPGQMLLNLVRFVIYLKYQTPGKIFNLFKILNTW